MHILTTRSIRKFYFTPGDLGFPNFRTQYGKIGVQICWDQWYPEGSRVTALSGAQVIFYPTSIGWHPHEKAEFGAAQLDAWKTIQPRHAIANGVYVAVVNRVGFEANPPMAIPGSSSGAIPSSPIPSAKPFPKRPTIKKKSSSSNAIPPKVKILAATGRSFAIAA